MLSHQYEDEAEFHPDVKWKQQYWEYSDWYMILTEMDWMGDLMYIYTYQFVWQYSFHILGTPPNLCLVMIYWDVYMGYLRLSFFAMWVGYTIYDMMYQATCHLHTSGQIKHNAIDLNSYTLFKDVSRIWMDYDHLGDHLSPAGDCHVNISNPSCTYTEPQHYTKWPMKCPEISCHLDS